ncbi:hypothetical protein M9458_049055, partial [Cirrhinus mrigala]
PPSVDSTLGSHHGCGLGPTWLLLLQVPLVSVWSTLILPVVSLAPPSIRSALVSPVVSLAPHSIRSALVSPVVSLAPPVSSLAPSLVVSTQDS